MTEGRKENRNRDAKVFRSGLNKWTEWNEPLSEALLIFYTISSCCCWSSLFLKRREEITLKNCILQVVLKEYNWNWGRVYASLFQDERFLGFTLVTSARGILRERRIVELSKWVKDHIKGKVFWFEKWV